MKNFKSILAKPSHESKPWAMWIWNLAISKKEMIEQLSTLIEGGFDGIAIRPGRDMVPAYLSDEFFELFEVALQIAHKHGVGIRIADDFSLPWSGVFDTIINQSKKLRAQYLVHTLTTDVTGKTDYDIELADPENTIVLALHVKEGLVHLADAKVLTPVTGKNAISWKVPQGDWRIAIFEKEYVRDLSGGYIPNAYNPKTAQIYIQNVLEPFKTKLAKYLPGTLQGFINEMPAYHPADNAIPWDDDLVTKFRVKYKRDLLKLLPALFFDTTNPSGRTREQIYDFLAQSMYERFAAPLEVWAKRFRLSQWLLCSERSIHRTANMLTEGFIPSDTQFSSVGLQNQDGTGENYAQLRALADINANQFRRETLTVIGRNRHGNAGTIQSFKNEIDQSLMVGASRIILDGCFFNIDQRSYLKTPYNPAWYSPGGDNLKALCDYAARAHECVKELHMSPQIAVLSPSSAILAEYLPSNSESARKGSHLMSQTQAELQKLNYDYDVITEDLLLSCSIRTNGEFGTADRIRKGNYQVLILPYAPLVSRSVLVFLEKLVSKEGVLLFIDAAPHGTHEDGSLPAVMTRINKLLAAKKGSVAAVAVASLGKALEKIPSTIKVTLQDHPCEDISCAHGSTEGAEVYIFHNTSDTQEHTAVVEFPAEKHFAAIDCDSNEILEIEDIEHDEGVCRLLLNFSPRRTCIIAATATKISTPVKQFRNGINPYALPPRNYRIVLKDQWNFEPRSMNALPLANWNVRIGLSRESGGFSHFYETYFQVKSIPQDCFLVLNRLAGQSDGNTPGSENYVEVSVNGARVEKLSAIAVPLPAAVTEPPPSAEGVSDTTTTPAKAVSQNAALPVNGSVKRLFGNNPVTYNINDHIVRGFNRISLRTLGMVSDPVTILYPPIVLGDFSISKGSRGWAIDKHNGVAGHDSWTKYGYPYLSGKGVYRQSFEIPNEYKRLILRFSNVSGSIDVSLNEKPLGVYHWHPMEIDITKVCEQRRNELTVSVANTIDNVLRMNGRPSGLIGEVYLDVY